LIGQSRELRASGERELAVNLWVQAADAYNAGMQYTVRNIPSAVDKKLRAKARAEGKSLNRIALEALELAAGISRNGKPIKYRDLSDLAGTWVEDPVFEEIRKEHDRIDPEMWR
jgi:hypothetical protein